MSIRLALPDDFGLIQLIAHKTWPQTYGEILSGAQLTYMLEKMYSIAALEKNYADGVRFFLLEEAGTALGFAAVEHNYKTAGRSHLHKIYVLPDAQGKNVGRLLMNHLLHDAGQFGANQITLNVNRHNKALHFYNKLGFEISETVDINIGNGYLMEDYVLKKLL